MHIRWMLVFTDPITGLVTLCKATPRVWLTSGKKISVRGAPLGQRRLSFKIESKLNDSTPAIIANISIAGEENSASIVPTKLALSLRAPDGYVLSGAVMNGRKIPESSVDSNEDTVDLSPFNVTYAQVIVFYNVSK